MRRARMPGSTGLRSGIERNQRRRGQTVSNGDAAARRGDGYASWVGDGSGVDGRLPIREGAQGGLPRRSRGAGVREVGSSLRWLSLSKPRVNWQVTG